MTDRPSIFSAPMVRALLDGRKTQTRRALPEGCDSVEPPYVARYTEGARAVWVSDDSNVHGFSGAAGAAVGDRLWVREAWRSAKNIDHMNSADIAKECALAGYVGTWAPIQYEADGARDYWTQDDWPNCSEAGRYRHARFMPRWASRLTLTVTEVRVQRLQDISEAEAVAEGIEFCSPPPRGLSGWRDYGDKPGDMTRRYFADPRVSYSTLWNSIHGPDAWDANPWVAAISFTVRKGNIDA
jgi:hypothetical protein